MLYKKTIVVLAALALTTLSYAKNTNEPLRGPDIKSRASGCGVGDQHGQFGEPLGQTTKAGEYNSLCSTLTDAEICLALVKRSMSSEGVLAKERYYSDEKVNHCIETFKNSLLGLEQ